MSAFRHRGPRTRRLEAALHRRADTPRKDWAGFDAAARTALFRKRAIVFTDTADFTTRTARDGILHFLMLFDALLTRVEPGLRAEQGDVVKVEGDSLMLRFPSADAACRGVLGVDRVVREFNRDHPARDRMAFSYGIGFGEMLDIEGDLFGLEVNLASKLGEDLAEPGEAFLTPSACAAVSDPAVLRLLRDHPPIHIGTHQIHVRRLGLGRVVKRVRNP